jgi:hypothetical protein
LLRHDAAARPWHRPIPSPDQKRGFQGPLPLAGVQRAAPSGGARGNAPAGVKFGRRSTIKDPMKVPGGNPDAACNETS